MKEKGWLTAIVADGRIKGRSLRVALGRGEKSQSVILRKGERGSRDD